MKLIRQIKLFFKEGNSDKVYEVDLCQVADDQYVVNFRFGKRGAVLKEGTKTASPVKLSVAENLFNGLEVEKRKKGYQSEAEMFQPLPQLAVTDEGPMTREQAIVKRLAALAGGQTDFKTRWKPSRVIWMAGRLRLTEAVPFLIRLVDRGDEMQRYATLWSLGRCGDPQAIRTVSVYYSNQKYTEKIRRIAGEALLHLLQGDEKEAFIRTLAQQIPELLMQAVFDEDKDRIRSETDRLIDQVEPAGDVLEAVYRLAGAFPVIRQPLLESLKSVPMKPGWFNALRHMLKIAELRDDFEMQGLLAYKLERTAAFFSRPKPNYYDYEGEGKTDPPRFLHVLNQRVRVKAELRKADSRLAYSDRTRAYLRRRLFRSLTQLGQEGNVDYVRLATGILLSYSKAADYTAPYEREQWNYNYNARQYMQVTHRYPAYANALLMNWILYGSGHSLEQTEQGIWMYRHPEPDQPDPVRIQTVPAQEGGLRGLFCRLGTFLHRPAPAVHEPDSLPATPEPVLPAREEMYPLLWDQMPQAYIQLLMRAQVDEIHLFAYGNLLRHPDYASLAAKADDNLIQQLLGSVFPVPVRWGVDLVRQRLDTGSDAAIVMLLLITPDDEAHRLAKTIVEKAPDQYTGNPEFLVQLLFSPSAELRMWLDETLQQYPLHLPIQVLLVQKALAFLDANPANASLTAGIDLLIKHTATALHQLDQQRIAGLLQTPSEIAQTLAVRLLILQQKEPDPQVVAALLSSAYIGVRRAGEELLETMQKRIEFDPGYARIVIQELVKSLIRRESSEGIHESIAAILRGRFNGMLAGIDRTTMLNLIYASFRPAQELGLYLLNTFSHSLTIRQVIALGNHELLAIRQWCWQYFDNHPALIRYEKEETIRLLDARWDDTRQAAMQFFRTVFTAGDWTPEALVGIADSVRPDIQAFGRELITRFFTQEDGPEYLLRLSQHPDKAVQLFTTNYLQAFATDQPERLRALSYYFRSVLLRPHRSRVARNRVFAFLRQEGLKSEDNARFVVRLLNDVSATSAIGVKAICITILRDIQVQYPVIDTILQICETR
nr:hypothetical protein [uncultured Arsenicibacter sp.]